MDPKIELLRHMIATVAYRADKALHDAPPGFGDYQVFGGVRAPLQILAHMGDLFDWTLTLLEGRGEWREAPAMVWEQEVRRFHASMKRVDDFLASGVAPQCPVERLMQGPVGDALTHVGQLMMLRRMASSPVRGENFFRAQISVGQLA